MVRGRGNRGFVPQDAAQRSAPSPRGRGTRARGRGGRGGPPQHVRRPDLRDDIMHEYEEFDFNDFNAQSTSSNPFAPRGRGRGRGFRGRGGRGGPAYQPQRRPDLVDDIMNQVEELDDDDFNFGINFRPLSMDNSPRAARGRGSRDWRGRDDGGRGRGRGRGSMLSAPANSFASEYVIGAGGPRRGSAQRVRGSGLGFASPKGTTPVKSVPGAVIDPSALPDYGRPLLRPVIFVRATLNKTLFQEVDEVLQAHELKLEDVVTDNALATGLHNHHDPALSHAPTADRVAAVFSIQDENVSADISGATSTSEEEHDEDNAHIISTPGTVTKELAPNPIQSQALDGGADDITNSAEDPTNSIETIQISRLQISDPPLAPEVVVTSEELNDRPGADDTVFIIDTTPAPSLLQQERIIIDDTSHLQPLGDDDEVILFNPPSRASKSKPGTPIPAGPLEPTTTNARDPTTSRNVENTITVDDISFSALKELPAMSAPRSPVPGKLAQLKQRVNARRAVHKQSQRRQSFGMLGALLEEARTREQALEKRGEKAKDPLSKKAWRGLIDTRTRHGGRDKSSDLDWGTSSGEEEEAEETVFDSSIQQSKGQAREVATSTRDQDGAGPDASLASMDIDPDLVEIDEGVFARFAKGLSRSANGAGQYVTIDDLDDAAKLAAEDEDDSAQSEEDEDESEEEDDDDELEAVIGVDSSSDSDDEDDDEDDEDDLDSIQSFDARLKKIRAMQKRHQDEDVSDYSMEEGPSKAKQDEAFIARLTRMVDDASAVRKKKGKPTFEDILKGDFELDESEEQYFPERIRRKDRGKTFVEPQLRVMWERDRQKKAERKREREKERLEAEAAAMSPRQAKQMGKRFRKDNRNKGNASGLLIAKAGRVTDFEVVETEIRAFIRNLSQQTMALPPLDKESRAQVHQIATVFGLKSKSTGKGDGRFITLYRISNTRETGINEKKLRRLVQGTTAPKGGRAPRHKEGDEVGKAAPKLNDSNLGYRLLQQMGWAEGDRIGLSTSGLEVPISAFIKTTKLGLGAR